MWITNPHQQSFLYFKSVTLVSLVSQNAEWGCARRCVVKNHTSHSGTRHLNWNIKVWQYPYPKQILISKRGSTKQNKHTQKYFAFHRSPIELQIRTSTLSGAANKELNPQIPHLRRCIFTLLQILHGLMGVTTLEYYGWRPCLCSSVLCTAYWRLMSDMLFLCRGEDLLNTKKLLNKQRV